MTKEELKTDLELQTGLNLKTLREEQLYILLKETVFTNMESTKSNPSERYDCVIPDGVIELKCRRAHYDTLRIEKSKYDAIINNKKPYYICSTPNGIYGFNLKGISPVWTKTLNPKTSEFSNREMIWKDTYDIPINDENDITEIIYKQLK